MAEGSSTTFDERLTAMEAALQDGEADLEVAMGGYLDQSSARLWKGKVLMDWEPDERAGGSLLRPGLVQRLRELGASVEHVGDELRLRAAPRVVTALSQHHARLAGQLGQPLELRLRLRFDGPDGAYTGGDEAYSARGVGGAPPLLRLTARIRPRSARQTSAQTPLAPS